MTTIFQRFYVLSLRKLCEKNAWDKCSWLDLLQIKVEYRNTMYKYTKYNIFYYFHVLTKFMLLFKIYNFIFNVTVVICKLIVLKIFCKQMFINRNFKRNITIGITVHKLFYMYVIQIWKIRKGKFDWFINFHNIKKMW